MAKRPEYGFKHQKARRAQLEREPFCEDCSAPAEVADHDPPLSQHEHIDGSGCCVYRSQCLKCSRAQGGRLASREALPLPERLPPLEEADIPTIQADDQVWDVPWLDDLRDVPPEATWPRFMTAPHPNAVGSYGDEVDRSARAGMGLRLRWWQRLVNRRLLEHDEDGSLVWLWAVLSAARQSGKSWGLRELGWWRLNAGELFGEPQQVVHTARAFAPARDVMRPAADYFQSEEYYVRRLGFALVMRRLADDSTWEAMAYNAAYSHSSSLAIVDEAWDVPQAPVTEGIEPTLLERASSQLLLVSTAHRRCTALIPHRRETALRQLRDPTDGLIMEWSAKRGADIEDRDAWRLASPHWTRGRERHIAGKVAAALRGEGASDSEPDPIEVVRTQYLNIWPLHAYGQQAGSELVSTERWAERITTLEEHTFVDAIVALEDQHGLGYGAVGAGMTADDTIVLSANSFTTRDEMLSWVAAQIGGISTVLAGVTLTQNPTLQAMQVTLIPVGHVETAQALPMLRRGVMEGEVLHVPDELLDGQMAKIRVRPTPGGNLGIGNRERSELVRCAAWAVRHFTHALGQDPGVS